MEFQDTKRVIATKAVQIFEMTEIVFVFFFIRTDS